MDTLCTRDQYSKNIELKVKTARTDYYKLPFEDTISFTRRDDWPSYIPTNQSKESDIYIIPAYPCPDENSLQVTPANEKITLTWTMPPGTTQSRVDDYKIKWRRKDGEWADVKNENDERLVKKYDPTETNPSVTFPYPAKDEGTKEYEFLVTRGAFNLEEAEYNVTRSATFNTDRVAATPATAEIQEHDSTTVKVSWTLNDGRFSTNYRCRIYRKDGTKPLVQVHEQPVAAGSTTVEWVDSFTVDCTPFYYEIRMFDGGDDVGGIGEYGQPFAKTGTLFMELRLHSIGAIANLSASKGYYDDKVLVKWDMTPRHRFKSFRLSRAIKNLAGAPTESLAEIPSGSVTNYMYEDKSAVQGIYYDYKVVGVTDCDGDIKEHSEKHSTGYKQPYGTVIGQIAFKSGSTSVVGATVTATTTPEAPNKAFEFTSDHQNYITTPIKANALSPSAFTFQAWVKPHDVQAPASLFYTHAGHYAVRANGSESFTLTVGTTDFLLSLPNAARLQADQYTHVTVTFADNTARLYINGDSVATATATVTAASESAAASAAATATADSIYLGKSKASVAGFTGFMDEVRIWKKALTPTKIKQDYGRFIAGKEADLQVYYRFDELSDDEVYDASATASGTTFNENHGAVHTASNTKHDFHTLTNAPNAALLANRAITDVNGSYILNTIPYAGDGTSFTLTPSLGEGSSAHLFAPTTRTYHFNAASHIYNSADFEDKSSFKVSGKVMYEGGNYPVEGCTFTIDGNQCLSNGKPITTAANGTYELEVPVGVHEFKVEKPGHWFAKDGKALSLTTGQNLDYQSDRSGVHFYDQTRVKVIGHIAGGIQESEVVSGFGWGRNNIGVDSLVFTAIDKVGQPRLRYEASGDTFIINLHDKGAWLRNPSREQLLGAEVEDLDEDWPAQYTNDDGEVDWDAIIRKNADAFGEFYSETDGLDALGFLLAQEDYLAWMNDPTEEELQAYAYLDSIAEIDPELEAWMNSPPLELDAPLTEEDRLRLQTYMDENGVFDVARFMQNNGIPMTYLNENGDFDWERYIDDFLAAYDEAEAAEAAYEAAEAAAAAAAAAADDEVDGYDMEWEYEMMLENLVDSDFDFGGFGQEFTEMKINGNEVTVYINQITGEYVAWLYPEVYNIEPIKTLYDGIIYNGNERLDLRDAPVVDEAAMKKNTLTWSDSVLVNGQMQFVEQTDTIRYHKEWNYIHRPEPIYTIQQWEWEANAKITGEGSTVNYFGEKEYVLPDTTLALVNLNLQPDDDGFYTFGKPVFLQGKSYTFVMNAEEYHVNLNSLDIIAEPAKDATFSITSTIAANSAQVNISMDAELEMGIYEFVVGAPSGDGVSRLSTTMTTGGRSYYSDNFGAKGLEAYVLGGTVTGTDFRTTAPPKVDFVLHDPPGTSSYAYISAGTTLVHTEFDSWTAGTLMTSKNTLSLGYSTMMVLGVIGTSASAYGTGGMGIETNNTSSGNGSTQTTYRFNRNFSTMGNPAIMGGGADVFVGDPGDLFVGQAVNTLYGKVNAVEIRKTWEFTNPNNIFTDEVPGAFDIGKISTMGVGESFETSFAYTEYEIEKIMVPKWVDAVWGVLSRIVIPLDESLTKAQNDSAMYAKLHDDYGVDTATISAPVYVSHLYVGDTNFGMLNSDTSAFHSQATEDGASSGPSYTVVWDRATREILRAMDEPNLGHLEGPTDSIVMAYDQINGWLGILAQNELAKLAGDYTQNASFGAGVGSVGVSTSHDTLYSYGSGYNRNHRVYVSAHEEVKAGGDFVSARRVATTDAVQAPGSGKTIVRAPLRNSWWQQRKETKKLKKQMGITGNHKYPPKKVTVRIGNFYSEVAFLTVRQLPAKHKHPLVIQSRLLTDGLIYSDAVKDSKGRKHRMQHTLWKMDDVGKPVLYSRSVDTNGKIHLKKIRPQPSRRSDAFGRMPVYETIHIPATMGWEVDLKPRLSHRYSDDDEVAHEVLAEIRALEKKHDTKIRNADGLRWPGPFYYDYVPAKTIRRLTIDEYRGPHYYEGTQTEMGEVNQAQRDETDGSISRSGYIAWVRDNIVIGLDRDDYFGDMVAYRYWRKKHPEVDPLDFFLSDEYDKWERTAKGVLPPVAIAQVYTKIQVKKEIAPKAEIEEYYTPVDRPRRPRPDPGPGPIQTLWDWIRSH
ncbi:LamG domain-containing protein, partial [Candidatus Symbiothrix dinenymphae]|uniref:LamG domain-containing protein n=1 Tax=Candidatus Symbiothrix dinenymphae TaxID=467085 RepID=UPI00131572B3